MKKYYDKTDTYTTPPIKNGNNECFAVDFSFRIVLQTSAPLNWCKYVTADAEALIKFLYGSRNTANVSIFAAV